MGTEDNILAPTRGYQVHYPGNEKGSTVLLSFTLRERQKKKRDDVRSRMWVGKIKEKMTDADKSRFSTIVNPV